MKFEQTITIIIRGEDESIVSSIGRMIKADADTRQQLLIVTGKREIHVNCSDIRPTRHSD